MTNYDITKLRENIQKATKKDNSYGVTLLLTLLGRIKYDTAVTTYESLQSAYASIRSSVPEDELAEEMVHEVYQNLLNMVAADIGNARGKQHLKKIRIETALELGIIDKIAATKLYELRSQRLIDLSITVSQDQINTLTDHLLPHYIFQDEVAVAEVPTVSEPILEPALSHEAVAS